MNEFPLMKHIPFLFKSTALIDVGTGQVLSYLLFFRITVFIYLCSTTGFCMSNSGATEDNLYDKFHDIPLSLALISFDIFLFANKFEVCSLLDYLLTPSECFEENTAQSRALKKYYKEVTLYFKVAIMGVSSSVVFYGVSPFISFIFQTEGDDNCLKLAIGWVNAYDSSFWYINILNHILSTSVLIWGGTSLFLYTTFIICVIGKLKLNCRLLCADLHSINEITHWSDEDANTKDERKHVTWEDSMINNPLKASGSEEKGARQEASGAGTQENVRPDEVKISKVQISIRERKQREIMKAFVGGFVNRHLSIIQHAKMVDEAFKFQLLSFLQIGTITIALAMPKISLVREEVDMDLIRQGVEVFTFLGVLGYMSYSGQTLVNESEALRQALYNCDWTDKPRAFRKDLLIMQIVAARPLRMTVGGIYTLDMENYGNLVRAVYSYGSVIQSSY